MMNIFDSLRKYGTPWQVVETRSFTEDEINAVNSASVVTSQYGLSVCFFLRAGGSTFIPLSNDSTLGVGQSVDIAKAELVTLQRDGEQIQRVKA